MKKSVELKKVLVTGGAGFIGSNLVLTLQERHPQAWIVVADDFRSGNFKNLVDFRGDVAGMDVSRMDWRAQFGLERFDAIFHEASITDTTEHDQRLQVHDNVEGFRRALEFARPTKTPVVYASSAATYGIGGAAVNVEDQPPKPANVYAFSKMILDNIAREQARRVSAWRIVGVRYFNVYGPREAHKGAAASMIYQLAQQIRAGKRPRVFKSGEQKRDFVYVKDVVEATLLGLNAPNGVYHAGSGHARSFNDVIAALQAQLGTRLETEYFNNPYPFYQPHTEADLSRSRARLGYAPKFSLEDGVRDYFKSGFLTL
ncbi:MAG: ADP-glyceromanno-heptose 6-epimerase [Verrucomicrobia bacterium]|nr:ADP-glyceromanno-heptose 6-epimerase [Verrucomicrobiota bacterium]